MIDHIGITVSNLNRSREFYTKSLVALGYVVVTDTPTSVGFGVIDGHGKSTDPGGDFWISEGEPMVPPVHFAFNATSHLIVDGFFTAGMAAGGTDNGTPGLRLHFHPNYYAAFLLDPDGYNIEAVCHLDKQG